jgi:hypothetical protein
LERIDRKRPSRGLLKASLFIALLLVLTVLSKCTVAYAPMPTGLAPLSDGNRDLMTVGMLNGRNEAISDDTHGDNVQLQSEMNIFNLAEGTVLLQPQNSAVAGCSTVYTNKLEVNFTISNSLTGPAEGTVNVSVTDYKLNVLLETKLLDLSFEPRVDLSRLVTFQIASIDDSPSYLVTVSFPTAEQLRVPMGVRQVPLFEYLLSQLGFPI